MKNVLVLSGLNLFQNSSVCLANSAYIKGFLSNGYNTTVIMPECDDADKDVSMKLPQGARYFEYARTSSFEKRIAKSVKVDAFAKEGANNWSLYCKRLLRKSLSKWKQRFLKMIRRGSFYKNSTYFINRTIDNSRDYCDREYDLIISLSSPVSTHYLAEQIIKKTNVKYGKWCQLWEDPWYYDLYTEKKPSIFKEEGRLLSKADVIEYVSPLTCFYQKKYFEEFANKMKWQFLPCYSEIQYIDRPIGKCVKLGYFGEYVSTVRNIEPLAQAVHNLDGFELLACGNTDLDMKKYNHVITYGRVSLDKVDKYQEESDILVNISNLRGGQIPGKVYQYAGTTKPILFLLDGSEEEKKILLQNFGKYNRYIFCENTVDSITSCLLDFNSHLSNVCNRPVSAFSPKEIVSNIINDLYEE